VFICDLDDDVILEGSPAVSCFDSFLKLAHLLEKGGQRSEILGLYMVVVKKKEAN
jgi:hypothetical protein